MRARRYRYVPREKQQMVVNKYFEYYREKGLLKGNTLEDLTEHELKLICGFIYGDLGFRIPSAEQALIYR